ncbi:MDR family NADP-dependent oxidoreductase [Sphingomonas psychrolutea]|uniref:NADP-dependent oxidoreductase n=1 Tax=Sphingomonas psychrolutea TaxID=1259676 RepID=A0ABQ1G500_9SPHN|nr:NADP-dependent oxidoreductase [Sphingomonas psychrolutea]GGA36887.1 NADP-dependent oxidoreductase [Sphingomonas psychrolutea]
MPSGQRVVLRHYPQGAMRASNFAIEDQVVLVPGDGEFLVRALYVSVDPMLRLFIDPAPLGGKMPPMPLGTTIPGPAVGEIVQSNHPEFSVGTIVEGRFGWQHHAVSNGAGVQRVNPKLGGPENALGIGGLPGFTAYVGLNVAGGVKSGQTFLVSGAAGAVGSAAGALIHARGGRVVGIAGGEAKCRYLVDQIGYDVAVDRHAPDFMEQLAKALPTGADVYFDNVGGPLLASVVPLLARGGLVLICGLMAQYQGDAESGVDHLPDVLRAVMFNSLRFQGFTQVGRDALRPAFEAELAELVASGRMKVAMHIEDGIERLPHAMAGLFDNSVTGKVVVRVGEISR